MAEETQSEFEQMRAVAEGFDPKKFTHHPTANFKDLDDLAQKIHDQWKALGLTPAPVDKIRQDLDKPQFRQAIIDLKKHGTAQPGPAREEK